ncbi:MAG: hypothetical protein AAFN10_11000 [Bacteroidota bacterium]
MKKLSVYPRLVLLGTLLLMILASCELIDPDKEPKENDNRADLITDTIAPQRTDGMPYPPVLPGPYIPNPNDTIIIIPDGPLRGNFEPLNDPSIVKELYPQGQSMEPLFYKDYADLDDPEPRTSQCCPEISVTESNQAVMMTGNFWMTFSTDGGGTFTEYNPTSFFPQSNGGFCCDQVVHYIPQYEMFVWLLQYRADSEGKNLLRLAVQTVSEAISSNGTSWTYYDFPSTVFSETRRLDYNDMSFGRSNLYFNTNTVGGGRHAVRIPLEQLQAKGSISYQYTGATDNAYFSHITQNAGDAVYWGGHISNSELRVYSMRDGDDFYAWRTVNVDSWPNGANKSNCPDGTDWLSFDANKNYIFGNVINGNNLWFAWLAGPGGGFPQSHVQMVRINTDTWNAEEQVQIWNEDFAFGYPYLSTNSTGEIGMSVGFGGGSFYASHAVGVWGDFVVYYPKLSDRCTNRWGDYNTARRATQNPQDWVAGGYVNTTDGGGAPIVEPHFIRFGR